MKAPKVDLDPSTVAILAGIAVGGFLLWRAGKAVAEAAPQAVEYTADMVGGVLTGNNAITKGARTDAYKDAGVIGTLGAATDRILGGVPSKVGEWLGLKLWDMTHD